MKRAAVLLTLAFSFITASALQAAGGLTPAALDLRNQGLAQLENEKPEKAEVSFRALAEKVPDDPLGHADLAIALLRQQKNEEALAAIRNALKKAPGRGDLLAIEGVVLEWAGKPEEALAAYERAAAAAPDDPEVLYALYRHAGSLDSEAAAAASRRMAEMLAALRPENVVVLLAVGSKAIARGDRTAATGAYLRLRELLWQAPPIAERAMEMVLEALEGPEVAAARVPALRFENVIKVTPMFRESLRELSTGIQGVPVARFEDEPPPAAFGEPAAVRFEAERLASEPGAGRALAIGDFDGDEKPDLARLRPGQLEVRFSGKPAPVLLPAPEGQESGLSGLTALDLDNDGELDLLGYGPKGMALWQGGEAGFTEATAAFGLEGLGAEAVVPVDFDIEGDLDLALAGGARGAGGAGLLLNSLEGPLAPVGEKALPAKAAAGARAVVASDFDRDGDLDLLFAGPSGLTLLDNLRQGRFEDLTAAAGLAKAAGGEGLASADLDNDGLPDLVVAGEGLTVLRNRGGSFEPLAAPVAAGRFTAVVAFDADNDGRLDLAAAGPEGVIVLGQRPGLTFEPLEVAAGPRAAAALAAADLDTDGDVDLVVSGPEGLHLLTNQGGNRNHWLSVRLRGLDKGSSKNNLFGVGSVVELRSGASYQLREAAGDAVHFGLGGERRSFLLRVVWTNGVPQQRLFVSGDQRVVEEQLLKGSCPFLYAWSGERMEFVTDLLWGAPLGLPVAPGVWASADPSELVRVDGAVPRDGRYELRVTEELWEAAFFDHMRLWVVDHPEDVEVASSLRILPGEQVPEAVLGSRGLTPVTYAEDGRGRDVTAAVRARDEVYADGFEESPYQGVAAEPWAFTFDLGTAPEGPVRLSLDGWIFPADASLNLAVAQRGDIAWQPPRLEVETASGWEVLMPAMGFPAGKTKTMVVDTPPLPEGARRLRIVTTLWLGWDRVAWTPAEGIADAAPAVRARLDPAVAALRFRGFSRLVRRSPNGPHAFDYQQTSLRSPWLPFPGRYTRYGDVRELLEAADDRSAILAAGDEIALVFDASHLPPPAAGWRRTVFLESVGWDKDADRNTFEAQRLEPLPFRAMSGYPWGEDESFPRSPELEEYRRLWLTREVGEDPQR